MPSLVARITLVLACCLAILSPLAVAHAVAAPAFEITELFPDPAAPLSDANDEFIEFHNLTNTY